MRRRRLQVATEETDPDDLEAEKGGASWRNLVGQGQGLKFEKTVEERRAELRRDDFEQDVIALLRSDFEKEDIVEEGGGACPCRACLALSTALSVPQYCLSWPSGRL